MGPCVDICRQMFYINVFKMPLAVSWRGEICTEKQIYYHKMNYTGLKNIYTVYNLENFEFSGLPLASEVASKKTT